MEGTEGSLVFIQSLQEKEWSSNGQKKAKQRIEQEERKDDDDVLSLTIRSRTSFRVQRCNKACSSSQGENIIIIMDEWSVGSQRVCNGTLVLVGKEFLSKMCRERKKIDKRFDFVLPQISLIFNFLSAKGLKLGRVIVDINKRHL